MRAPPFLLLTLALAWSPGAAFAQQEMDPPNQTGNTGEPPGEQESLEGAPGVAYGVMIVVGMLAFAGALAYVSLRQQRALKKR